MQKMVNERLAALLEEIGIETKRKIYWEESIEKGRWFKTVSLEEQYQYAKLRSDQQKREKVAPDSSPLSEPFDWIASPNGQVQSYADSAE